MKMASSQILLPGEEIPSDQLPKSKKGTLTLGPGLRHIPPTTITSTTAGSLHIDYRKSALWLERDNGRYQPTIGDLVVAQVHHSGGDVWHCSLTSHTPFALLGQLAFESVTKKTRPNLKAGDVVYARVVRASKWEDTEIECYNSATGKAEGMGQLKDGMLFMVSPGFARRLMMGNNKNGENRGGIILLEKLGEKIKFEIAVGRNGKVWVDGGSVANTIMVGKLLKQADEAKLNTSQQAKAVESALRGA
jgi:exosome complex component RRP40